MFVTLETEFENGNPYWNGEPSRNICPACFSNFQREVAILEKIVRGSLWCSRDDAAMHATGLMKVSFESACEPEELMGPIPDEMRFKGPEPPCRLEVDVTVVSGRTDRPAPSHMSFHWISDCDEAVSEFPTDWQQDAGGRQSRVDRY
jgi:hypothetical protein